MPSEKFIGGFWPEVQFIVEIITYEGVADVVCSIGDVPFGGTWDGTWVSVSCLWSDRELEHNLSLAQNWEDCYIVQTQDEQLQTINERLNILLAESPQNWLG